MALRSLFFPKLQPGPHTQNALPRPSSPPSWAFIEDSPGYLPFGFLLLGFGDAVFAAFGLAFFIWLSWVAAPLAGPPDRGLIPTCGRQMAPTPLRQPHLLRPPHSGDPLLPPDCCGIRLPWSIGPR